MGATGSDALLDGAATVNDALRELFFDSGTELEFVKASPINLDVFVVVDTLSQKWFAETSDFGKRITVSVAEDATLLSTTMLEATHIRIGGVGGIVYTINRRDTVAPMGTNVEWIIAGDRLSKRGNYPTLY